MSWDQALLRKYSSTSHFRLLNQLRNELRAQAISRASEVRGQSMQSKPVKVVLPKTNKRDQIPEDSFDENNTDQNKLEQSGSFRDRLNAIDMR